MPEIDQFTRQGLDAQVEREEVSLGEADELAARKYDDEAALKILKQDLETGEADKVLLDFTHLWTVADQLLQSPWLSTYFFNPAKANVPRYTLSNIIDVVTTKIHGALFFEEVPFMLLPNKKRDWPRSCARWNSMSRSIKAGSSAPISARRFTSTAGSIARKKFRYSRRRAKSSKRKRRWARKKWTRRNPMNSR